MSEETEGQKTEAPGAAAPAFLRSLLRGLGDDPANPYRPEIPTEVRIPRSLLILCIQTGAGAILELAKDKSNQPKEPKEAANYALAGLGAIGILAVAKQLENESRITTIQLVDDGKR